MRKGIALFLIFLSLFLWGCSKSNNKLVIPTQESKPAVNNTSQPVNEQDKSNKTDTKTQNNTESSTTKAVQSQTSPEIINPESIPGNYSVKVDISEQKVYVYKGNELVRKMICSTGIEEPETRTPRGQFIINKNGDKKGEWFYSQTYKQGAKYWVGFIGGEFLFHSVPMDINKNVIQSEAEKLGTPASHGCVRLSIDDAYWFYKTIPKGTNLIIQD